ncbi:MAG: hypothetical protein JNK82_02660 [Myxococcaceae bacterium]|nr:hypothetical protein [Myxococcaceae bacterium]
MISSWVAVWLAASPCAAEVEDTAKWLRAFAAQVDHVGPLLPNGLQLDERPGKPLSAFAVTATITLDETETTLSGVPAGDLQRALRESRAVKLPLDVGFAIDRAARWEQVVAAADAFTAVGLESGVLLFAERFTPAPPGPSAIDEDVKRAQSILELPERVGVIGALGGQVMKRCQAAVEAFYQKGSSQELRTPFTRLADALPKCECKLELPALRKILWESFAPNPPMLGVKLKLGAKGRVVKLAAGTSWSSAAETLVKAAAKGDALKLELTKP